MHMTALQNLQVLLPYSYFVLVQGVYHSRFMPFGGSQRQSLRI